MVLGKQAREFEGVDGKCRAVGFDGADGGGRGDAGGFVRLFEGEVCAS